MKALVYIETKDGAPVGGSLELFGAAASIGAEAEGIVIGDEAVAKAAADAVGASVSYVEADDCEDVITDVVAKAAAGADVVFVAATPTGKVVAPRIGARLDAGVVNDITGINADDGILITRPAFGGSILEQIKIKTPVAVVSVRPGSFEKPAAAAGTVAKSANLLRSLTWRRLSAVLLVPAVLQSRRAGFRVSIRSVSPARSLRLSSMW